MHHGDQWEITSSAKRVTENRMKPYWQQDENKMIEVYLACPYSPPKTWFWKIFGWLLRWWRFRQVNKKAAELMMQGYLVFSPLSHSHPISKYCNVDPCDHDFWLRQDLWILDGCDEFHILCLDGWKTSKGIQIVELPRAKSLGKKIVHQYM